MTDAWVDLDISTAVMLGGWGQYGDGVIYTATGFPDFYFPGLVFDATKFYELEVTFDSSSVHDSGGRAAVLGAADAADVPSDYAAGYSYDGLYPGPDLTIHPRDEDSGSGDVILFYVGPSRHDWDAVVVGDGRTAPVFETIDTGAVSAIRYRVVTFTTTSGTVTAGSENDWTIVDDATGRPTTYTPGSGPNGLTVFYTSSDSSTGSAYADVSSPLSIPDDSIVTVPHIFVTGEGSGGHVAPVVRFNDRATPTHTIADWAKVGAAGVGDTFDVSPGSSTIDYDDAYYVAASASPPFDPQGWHDAARTTGTVVFVTLQSSSLGSLADGDWIRYHNDPPLLIEWAWVHMARDPGPGDPDYPGTGSSMRALPLRLTNRDDQWGTAGRPTGSTSTQGSNRVTGYL